MDEILLIALLPLVVWAGAYLFRGSLIHGCLAFLVLGYCFGHPFLHFRWGPVPLTLERLLLVGLVAAYLFQRRIGRADPKPWAWIDTTVLMFAAVLTASTFMHDWQTELPDKVPPVWRLVAGYLMPVVLYWIARQSRLGEREVVTAYSVLALLGLYLTFTALAEIGQQWWLVFPKHIADPKLGIHFGRARGPNLQSQSLGLHLNICLLSAWMLRNRLGRAGYVLLALYIPASVVAAYVTYTRCVWLSLALGTLVILGLVLHGRQRIAVLGSLALACLVATVLSWESVVSIERQSESGAGAARESVNQRASFTYVSWRMFLDHPLLGVGFSQYNTAAQEYLSDRSTDLELEMIRNEPNHNTFLGILTETGLLGFGLYVAILFGWLQCAWRLWRDPQLPDWIRNQGLMLIVAVAMYSMPALFFDMTFSPDDHWLLFFLAGMTVGLKQGPARQNVSTRQEPGAMPSSA